MKSHWPISILSTVSALVNMALPLVLVRLLSTEDIGHFKIFFLYLMIFPPFALMTGVTNGLSYWAGHAEKGRALIRASGRLILVTGILFLAGCLALHGALEAWLGWSAKETAIFSVALFATITSTFFEDSAIAIGQLWRGALFPAVWELARTLAILVVGALTRNVLDIFIAHTSVLLLKTLTAFILAESTCLRGTPPIRDALKQVLRYGFPVSLACVFGVFVNYSDQMMVSKFLSTRDFAFYAVGCLSVPPLTILEFSITRVLIPQLSQSFARGEPARAARLYSKAVEELGFFLIPAVAGMVIFAEPIIHVLFTSKFAGAEGYLRVYAFTYLALMIPYDSIPRARGEARWIFWNFLGFSVLSLGLCFGLIRKFGPFGALGGMLASWLLMRAYGLAYIRKSTGWRAGDYLPLRSISRFSSTAAALGIGCWAVQGLFASSVRWFLVMGPVFSIAYFVALGAWSRYAYFRSPQSRKVMMLTQYLGLGGLERMILNLSIALKEQGNWEPQVFVFEHSRYAEPESHLGGAFEQAGIPAVLFSKGRGFSIKAVLKIAQTVLSEEISVIHSHDLGALIYGACAKLATFGRVRLVHTQHSFVHLGRARRYRLYEKLFTFLADEIAVVSPDTRETYLALGVRGTKLHVVPNGVRFPTEGATTRAKRVAAREAALATLDEDKARRLRTLGDCHWVLYMARIHGRKGQDQAIRLWSALDPGVRARTALLFVGLETEKGQGEKLRQLIDAAPDCSRALCLGPSQRPELWLQAAEVFLSSSEFEGMPLASIEAAGAGLPLVLSRIPGHESLQGRSAQYPLERPELGARALERIIAAIESDPEGFFRSAWVNADPLRSRFSLAAMASAYAALYPWERVQEAAQELRQAA